MTRKLALTVLRGKFHSRKAEFIIIPRQFVD